MEWRWRSPQIMENCVDGQGPDFGMCRISDLRTKKKRRRMKSKSTLTEDIHSRLHDVQEQPRRIREVGAVEPRLEEFPLGVLRPVAYIQDAGVLPF